MAHGVIFSLDGQSRRADSWGALFNSGHIDVFSGTKPAGPTSTATDNVKLFDLTYGAGAFATAVSGVITANAMSAGTVTATGTATWFRAYMSSSTAMWDGTVGNSGCDLNLDNLTATAGTVVTVTSHTWTEASATG